MNFEIHNLIAQSLAEENWITSLTWWPHGFNRAWVLWFMMIPALMMFWIWIRRSRAVPIPVDHSPHNRGIWSKLFINMSESLVPLMLAVVIWILAGPMELGRPVSKRALTNIQFCVDISGSMSASFGGAGTRYDASMAAINEFLDFREGDAFGLSFFGNSVMHWCPLTTDSSAIRCSPPFMPPGRIPGFGGTEIGRALKACRELLIEREKGDRMIVPVSDGSSSDLFGGNDTVIAQQLNDADITVYAIHIAEGEAPPPVVNITTLTGGEVFTPGDENALASVFQTIDSMEKAEMEKTVAEQLDNFKPYSIIGLFFLGLFVLTSYGLRYTPW